LIHAGSLAAIKLWQNVAAFPSLQFEAGYNPLTCSLDMDRVAGICARAVLTTLVSILNAPMRSLQQSGRFQILTSWTCVIAPRSALIHACSIPALWHIVAGSPSLQFEAG
jgi:hypothetical protein